MKRLFAILAFACTMSMTARAQVGSPRSTFAFGASGGVTMSNVSFTPKIKQDLYMGKSFGLAARYTSEKYFFLVCAAQLEANIAERGWQERIEDGSGNEYYRSMTYLEVPFFAHLGVGREARGLQAFLNLGPQIGILLNETETYGGQEPWDTSKRPNGVIEQYGKDIENRFEYGITGGLGVELKTGIGNFSLEGRYYFGLSDIFGNSKKDYFSRSASTTIYARLAYMFEIK